MKKIFYLASIAALAFSSCAKDETTGSVMGTVGGSKIKAAVEADDTRTHLEEVDGKYEFRWSKNDILGVYGDGENSAPNVAFTLLDSSIDQAAGVFESNYKLLEGDNYVAYYPYQPGSDMVPTWTYDAKKNATLDASKIKLSIPAKQNYAPASFNTLTAPAISDTFVLDEDGNADVTMQPVADYLFVNMMSTEPIQKLTLKLYDNKNGKWLNIAGEGTLYPYVIEDTKDVRYYLGKEDMTEPEITLNSGQLTGAVCHEPNVYVFTIPAGILGRNLDISARIIVNGGTVSPATENINWFQRSGSQLNGDVIKADGKTIKEDLNVFRELDKSGDVWVATRRMENTVFWMNEMVDTDGDGKNDARGSFLYNPEKAFIIRNEVDFLKYMNEYESSSEDCGGKDAFVCSEYKFDFSEDNMGKLATQVKEEYLRAYVSDYIANGMPCIREYENDFRGNGATLKGIANLQSYAGLFGNITGTINEITFDGIAAKYAAAVDTRATGSLDMFAYNLYWQLADEGAILGSALGQKNINKVVVKNANGGAVFVNANVAALNGVTYDGVSGLNNIVNYFYLDADLDMTKTWDSVKGVNSNVFGIVFAAMGKDNADAKAADGHHVITIAKGGDAEYKTLAQTIFVAGSYGDTDWLYDMTYGYMHTYMDKNFDYAKFVQYWAKHYADLDAANLNWYQDNLATSVVIEGVSYWTGDFIDNVVADAKTGNFAIAYAEQLANGLDGQAGNFGVDTESKTWAILQNNINLNYENNNTLWPMSQIVTGNLDGNKKTITGFEMIEDNGQNVAPFVKANEIKDLIVDGVNILVKTNDQNHTPVPARISGLVDKVMTGLTNVVVNGVNFAAYDYAGGFNDKGDAYYNTSKQPIIGWVAGFSTDAQYNKVSANVTSSNIKGISGLTGYIELMNASSTESHFEDCSLTTGKIAQQPLTDFVPVLITSVWGDNDAVGLKFSYSSNEYVQFNYAGSMVGFVANKESAPKSIEFNGSGAPKFVYFAGHVTDDNKINVLYNDKKHTTLLGLDY